MRVVICWSHISGYITSCWRAFARHEGIDAKFIAFKSDAPGSTINFGDDLVRDLNCRLLDDREQQDLKLVRSLVREHKPDVVVIPGWFVNSYVDLSEDPELAAARFIMTMDTPWKGTLRQKLGRFAISKLLGRISGVVVAGERAFQLARGLGIDEDKILRGVYGFDEPLFRGVYEQRAAQPWPKKFLFVGRYVQDKAIDVLAEGYRQYRSSVPDAWPLTCCGKGPMADLLRIDGVDDRGFLQPRELPALLREHGAYVIASRYEPWGVAIAEALSSGLPVLCTEACGASVEVVRSYFNGLTVASENPAALANGMRWMHDHYDDLPAMGANGPGVAAAFSAEAWATRWHEFMKRITSPA